MPDYAETSVWTGGTTGDAYGVTASDYDFDLENQAFGFTLGWYISPIPVMHQDPIGVYLTPYTPEEEVLPPSEETSTSLNAKWGSAIVSLLLLTAEVLRRGFKPASS